MDRIAIDLGGRESQICVRNDRGRIVEEKRVKTEALGVWLQGRPAGRVIVETCSESFAAVAHAQAVGHEIRVVPATLVRRLGVGARRLKTDRRDAQVLSQVSTRVDLPSVHVPSEQSRERKAICTTRQALVRSRTQLINSVRGWFKDQGSKDPTLVPHPVPHRTGRHFCDVATQRDHLPVSAAPEGRASAAYTDEISRTLPSTPAHPTPRAHRGTQRDADGASNVFSAESIARPSALAKTDPAGAAAVP